MKKIAELFITTYQLFLSPLLKTILGVNKFCLSTPSCSEYIKQAIQKKGVVLGVFLGAKRLSQCRL